MEDEAAKVVLSALALKNGDGEDMAYVSHKVLDTSRRQVMTTAFPEVEKAGKAFEVVATRESEMKEFTVTCQDESLAGPAVVMGSCAITCEDLTPSDCIEYSFPESPDQWAMTQLSLEALETYRGMKFEAWKNMLVNPTCQAQFRRMLQIGMICEMYDPQVFPTPEALKASYQVTDEGSGKLMQLPHPVKSLRVWDASAQAYKPVEGRLTGAPSAAEATKWWSSFVEELNSKHGAEYIASLMQGVQA